MKTLADYLRPGLDVVSVGLNPSLPSVAAGFYFANPRNRFWRALNASGLVARELEPSPAAMDYLFEHEAIGFTDVVKRPTAGAGDLRAADYRAAAGELESKLLAYRPAIVWFHGKVAYGQYLKYTGSKSKGAKPGIKQSALPWGKQDRCIGDSLVYVTPNPSPANAAFSLDDLSAWFRRLARLRNRLREKAK